MKAILWIFCLCGWGEICINNSLYAGGVQNLGSIATHWVSPTGSDTNPCTQVASCRTIGFVLAERASDGDIVFIEPSIYRERLDITHSDLTLEGVAEGFYLLGSFVPDLAPAEGLCKAPWFWGASFEDTADNSVVL